MCTASHIVEVDDGGPEEWVFEREGGNKSVGGLVGQSVGRMVGWSVRALLVDWAACPVHSVHMSRCVRMNAESGLDIFAVGFEY